MLRSTVIEVAGIFAGAAIHAAGAYRFVAVNPRLRDMDRSEFPSLEDIRRAVRARLAGCWPMLP